MLFVTSFALAHQPYVVGDANASAEAAFPVADPDISIVVYAERTCDAPQVWLEAEVEEGFGLYVQLGLPVADALEGWRPSLAVVAPGLPEVDLGFALPEGMGAVVFPGAEAPTTFQEPFSGTTSWVMVEQTVELPEGGPVWVVAWDPAGAAGRLWVATGVVEDFSDADWGRIMDLMPDIATFHGTDGSVVPGPELCEEAETEAGEPEPTACATTGPARGLLPALLATALLRRRRAGKAHPA
jgi:hypothetical protein